MSRLVLNAQEALSAGGTITVKTVALDGTVEFCVADDGKGISRDFMEKELFLPFHTTKGTGLGIGLFQSKKIMEAHEGSIHLRSVEGEGTTVTATSPVPHQSVESQTSTQTKGVDWHLEE